MICNQYQYLYIAWWDIWTLLDFTLLKLQAFTKDRKSYNCNIFIPWSGYKSMNKCNKSKPPGYIYRLVWSSSHMFIRTIPDKLKLSNLRYWKYSQSQELNFEVQCNRNVVIIHNSGLKNKPCLEHFAAQYKRNVLLERSGKNLIDLIEALFSVRSIARLVLNLYIYIRDTHCIVAINLNCCDAIPFHSIMQYLEDSKNCKFFCGKVNPIPLWSLKFACITFC